MFLNLTLLILNFIIFRQGLIKEWRKKINIKTKLTLDTGNAELSEWKIHTYKHQRIKGKNKKKLTTKYQLNLKFVFTKIQT